MFRRTIRLSLMASLFLIAIAWPAVAQWQTLPPDQAHLVVLPGAFGTQAITRTVQIDPATDTRYEGWSMHLDPVNRFFRLFLRENGANAYIRDPVALQPMVAEMMNNPNLRNLRFDSPTTLRVGLGTADILTFSMGEIGCAAFYIGWGELRGEDPANSLKGYYCDPIFSTLPSFEISQTLDSIGVLGTYMP